MTLHTHTRLMGLSSSQPRSSRAGLVAGCHRGKWLCVCWDNGKELEVQNTALPLKSEAGTGSGVSVPSPWVSTACLQRWARGGRSRGPSAPRAFCWQDGGSGCLRAVLAEGRAGHRGCAAVRARRARRALSRHTEVAHLAPSTAGPNFVPAQVPLS